MCEDAIKRIKIVCKTNEEWRHERANSIGASAVGSILGMSHFRTPYETCTIMKAERKGEFDYTESLAMLRGHAYESGVAMMWSHMTGKQVVGNSQAEYIVRREDIPFMHASPDRTYWLDENGTKTGKTSEQNKGILECKTTRMPVDPDNLPQSWLIQLQVQMGVCGYPEGYLAWDSLTSADGFGYQRFEFNEDIFNSAVSACKEFWFRSVLGDELPLVYTPTDIVNIYPSPFEGKTVNATTEVMETIDKLKELKGQQKNIDDEVKQCEDFLKMQMKDGEESILLDGKPVVTWKATKPTSGFDSKLFKAENEEMYNKYVVAKPGYRRFVVK